MKHRRPGPSMPWEFGAVARAKFPLGPGGPAGPAGRCRGGPRGGPPLEAVEQRERRSGLAGRASRCVGRGPLDRWSKLQPVLAHPWAETNGGLARGPVAAGAGRSGVLPRTVGPTREKLDPPPLLTGDDLRRHGLRPGPKFKTDPASGSRCKLDGAIQTKQEALKLAIKLVTEISE